MTNWHSHIYLAQGQMGMGGAHLLECFHTALQMHYFDRISTTFLYKMLDSLNISDTAKRFDCD